MRKYRLLTLLAATAAIVGMSQVAYGGNLVDPSMDHLTCYRVRPAAGGPANGFPLTVQLENQWGFAACALETPPFQLCAETRKNQGDDPRRDAAGDYLCYRVRDCQIDPSALGQRALFNDQFGDWDLRVARQPRQVCLPANKLQHGNPGG